MGDASVDAVGFVVKVVGSATWSSGVAAALATYVVFVVHSAWQRSGPGCLGSVHDPCDKSPRLRQRGR